MSATRAPEHDPAGAPAVTTVADADELAALREIVQLGSTAPTWDELMQLIVDRSTVAMHAEVCSLYLVDRDLGGTSARASPASRPRRAPRSSAPTSRTTHATAGSGASTTSASRRSSPCPSWSASV
jgi:GAF domain-containing protein